MPDGFEVRPDLVGAAGVNLDVDYACAKKHLDALPRRVRGQTFGVWVNARAIAHWLVIDAQREQDLALCRGELTQNDATVDLAHLVGGDGGGEYAKGGRVFADRDKTANAAVQALGEAGLVADRCVFGGEVRDDAGSEGIAMAGPGVRRKVRGFVDDEEVGVLVNHDQIGLRRSVIGSRRSDIGSR